MPSAFENFFLRTDDKLIAHVFQHINPGDATKFNRLNSRLCHWYSAQSHRVWDFRVLAGGYVKRPDMLLALMEGSNAMMYGESILRFFLRCRTLSPELDICATLPKFGRICQFLIEDGYQLDMPRSKWNVPIHDKVSGIIRRTFPEDSQLWSLTADQSDRSSEHIGYVFRFTRTYLYSTRSVKVHLIRCEPYRHVLASTISTSFFAFTFSPALILARSPLQHL